MASVIPDSVFATVEDTAAILGVSKARLKRLLRIAGPRARAKKARATVKYKASSNGRWKKAVVIATRRKQKRGKTKKAAH